ncbi:MAG: peptidoglycan-binding protein [Magnetospirillum sp.]|nr:peptidoglycan-binding protein [Magnetospirillum sp.]
MNTKRALNALGYYDVPPERGIDDCVDGATFEGIRQFQRDNGLKVDGFMRPEGPTERKINASLSERGPGVGEGETLPPGSGGPRDPGNNMPVGVPPNVSPNMPVLTEPLPQWKGRPYWDKRGFPVIEGVDPRNNWPMRPPRGPY